MCLEFVCLNCISSIEIVGTHVTGRSESYLLLAKEAFQQNFDGKAVDHVSLALYVSGADGTLLWKIDL